MKKIVIEIPDEIYKGTMQIKENRGISSEDVIQIPLECISNGTVLPDNHGRLIDADVFEKRLMDARSYYIGEKADDFDLRFAAGLKSAAERLVDAPTIIEADKSERTDA